MSDRTPQELAQRLLDVESQINFAASLNGGVDPTLVTMLRQDATCIRAEFERRKGNGNSSGQHTQPKKEQLSWVTAMDEIKEEPTEWLWRPRIALSRMTLIGGDPGTGKTYAALAIAAAESVGRALPGGTKPNSPSNVLLISLEDGLPDIIKPRLRLLNPTSRIRCWIKKYHSHKCLDCKGWGEPKEPKRL